MKSAISNARKSLVRFAFGFESFAKNMQSPGKGLFGYFAAQLMAESNNRSVKDAVSKLQIKPGDHYLELGAGNGYGLLCANKFNPSRLIAVEISSRFRDMISGQGIPKTEVHGSDAIDMSSFLSNHSVDALLAMNVVYFLDPLPSYAAELKRVLKPKSGKGIIGVKPKAIETGNPGVFKNKSIPAIKKCLEEAGLTVREEFVDLGNPVLSYVAIHISH